MQPQPGETWQHTKHGNVRIVRAMSDDESWCELQPGRCLPIYNCFLTQPISETETQTTSNHD